MSDPMQEKQQRLESSLRLAPVVAVVVIERLQQAVPLARALVAGGIRAIEITLRTPIAIEAIRAIAAEVEGAEVGAGTVLGIRDMEASADAGARFAVSPGATTELLRVAADLPLPYLPGAATASEAMTLFEAGYRLQKLFPAEAVGGLALLRAPGYLALPNVVCVGGSWLTPADRIEAGDWAGITALAREAAALRAA
jgi:2-dehydro-3-deoxyphosphogluconate aldolase / (4S)-4-hydroxy-2-oxoglutarate aldolase